MAVTDFDTLEGELELVERPGTICYGKPADFIKTLLRILKVKFPVSRGNNFIVSGNETPSTDDTDKLWAKFSSNRNPLGWFAFVKGKWQRFYTVAPGEIRWFLGDSTTPPAGWQVIDENVSGVPSSVLDNLMSEYVESEDTPGTFLKYAARFIGY